MSNATRWYTTREAVKAAVGISGSELDTLLDGYIEAGSEDVEREILRRFIPETATKLFRWPQRLGNALVLRFPDEDLISVTTLKSEAQDSSPTTITAADFFVEPVNEGPPFTRIEIDLSSSAAFSSGDTPQRSLSVEGRWGYREDTKAAGALAEADDGAELELNVTDSSLIGVGDTIVINDGTDDEAMFVSKKALLDVGTDIDGALTATKNQVTVAVDDGTAIIAGEVITVDSERMLVESISGNNLTVERAVDASVLAAHNNNANIFAPRTLTVVRGVNGTSAASHNNATAITKYAPPADVVEYVRAYAIAHHQQGRSGWSGIVGGDQAGVETKMFGIWAMRQALIEKYRKVSL